MKSNILIQRMLNLQCPVTCNNILADGNQWIALMKSWNMQYGVVHLGNKGVHRIRTWRQQYTQDDDQRCAIITSLDMLYNPM